MGGRGSDEGAGKQPGSRGFSPVSGQEDVPGWKDAIGGAPGAACPQGTRALLRGADKDVAPIGAPLPHASEDTEKEGAHEPHQ